MVSEGLVPVADTSISCVFTENRGAEKGLFVVSLDDEDGTIGEDEAIMVMRILKETGGGTGKRSGQRSFSQDLVGKLVVIAGLYVGR